MNIDFRTDWKGWNDLPIAKEGHTGKYIKYQTLLFETVKELKPINILEIGFNAGHSACCFLNAFPSSKMVTFDICRHGTEDTALKVLQSHFDITLVKGDSVQTIPEYLKENDTLFDFVFIDGWHSKDHPYLDIINTKDRINSGGIIVVDDMNVGTVANCYARVDWSGFEEVELNNKTEKEIKILRKK